MAWSPLGQGAGSSQTVGTAPEMWPTWPTFTLALHQAVCSPALARHQHPSVCSEQVWGRLLSRCPENLPPWQLRQPHICGTFREASRAHRARTQSVQGTGELKEPGPGFHSPNTEELGDEHWDTSWHSLPELSQAWPHRAQAKERSMARSPNVSRVVRKTTGPASPPTRAVSVPPSQSPHSEPSGPLQPHGSHHGCPIPHILSS